MNTKSKQMNVFWATKPLPGNFGDILTPVILTHYGYDVHYMPQESPDFLCVGSIAKFARKDTVVLGSGAMSRENKLHPDAKWIWVRGPQTRKMILEQGGYCPPIYGDPALLLNRFYQPIGEKTHNIGIIPHYVDYQWAIMNLDYSKYKIINLLNSNVFEVIDEICSCDMIISSSLHGIIVAHTYGIPAAWVKLSDKLSGDGIKFQDHFESVGCDTILSTLDNPVFQSAKYDNTQIHTILADGGFMR